MKTANASGGRNRNRHPCHQRQDGVEIPFDGHRPIHRIQRHDARKEILDQQRVRHEVERRERGHFAKPQQRRDNDDELHVIRGKNAAAATHPEPRQARHRASLRFGAQERHRQQKSGQHEKQIHAHETVTRDTCEIENRNGQRRRSGEFPPMEKKHPACGDAAQSRERGKIAVWRERIAARIDAGGGRFFLPHRPILPEARGASRRT